MMITLMILHLMMNDDEWLVKENETNSTLDASNVDILIEVRRDEDASGGVALAMDDLKFPPIAVIMKVMEEMMTLMKMKIMLRKETSILRLI